jgi:hypothetical protein
MAIEILQQPLGAGADAGMFNLPPKFDQTKLAAEWVEEGQVQMKRQRQALPQTGMSADGWEIWKAAPGDGPTIVHTSGSRKFVLMCRDKAIQEQVNALYGNVSKKILEREIKGETVTGATGAVQDPGILTEQRLKNVLGGDFSGGGDTQPNAVPPAKEKAFESVEAATAT